MLLLLLLPVRLQLPLLQAPPVLLVVYLPLLLRMLRGELA